MSRDVLPWLRDAQASGHTVERHDSARYGVPVALGERVLRYVLGGMAREEAPWPGTKGVAPGQRGPADFGLSRNWPPTRPLHAERVATTTTREETMANVYGALGWHGSRAPGDELAVVRSVRTPPGLEDVRIDHAFVEHVAKHPSRGKFASYILPTLRTPHEVWLTQVGSGSGPVCRPHFLAAFDDGTTVVIVVKSNEESVAWSFFPVKRRTTIRKRRRGLVVYAGPNSYETGGARRR